MKPIFNQAQPHKRRVGITLILAVIAVPMLLVLTSSCTTLRQPSNTADLCQIFAEKRYWYGPAVAAEKKWNIEKEVMMAVINQESSYIYDARPPRQKILGFIPWKRPSNAYGYAQALDATWEDYKGRNNRPRASRTNFRDSIDFVGWYLDSAVRQTGLPRSDAKSLYLTYHEGVSGYLNGTWKNKQFVKVAATKVERTANNYRSQLADCNRGPAGRRG